MSDKFEFTGEQASKAMLEGLVNLIKQKLRERILEKIESDIQTAIDESLKAFEINLTSYKDFGMGRDIVRILIERKDKDV